MEGSFCQSCGMPMGETDELYGRNEDGTKNDLYCEYCFQNGSFTSVLSMEEMIAICVPHVVTANPSMNEDEARDMMREFLPTLKRWKRT